MKPRTFTLTLTEAAYVVGALKIATELCTTLQERDREAMTGIMDRLAAPMDLSNDVTARLLADARRQS